MGVGEQVPNRIIVVVHSGLVCYILLDYKIYVKGSLKNRSACVCIDPLHAMSQLCTSVYLCTRWGTANCFSNAMYTRRRNSVDRVMVKLCRHVS